MKIGIASQNPVKANSIVAAFERLYPHDTFTPCPVASESGVPDQPMSDAETWMGANNRLIAVKRALPDCDYWAAVEGGIDETRNGMIALAWILIASRTGYGEAKTATFPIPPKMAQMVRDGTELGIACDILYGKQNSKHSDGAIGLLSNSVIDRQAYYEHAAVMALLPIRHPDAYADDSP